jgi:hypothetical protein
MPAEMIIFPDARREIYAHVPGLYQLFPEDKGAGGVPHQWRNTTRPRQRPVSFPYVYSKARKISTRETAMPRELDEKDIAILKKLAPECKDLTCSGSDHRFHSILPPLSNHFAEDNNDFIERINRLSNEELTYITDMIRKGEESMGCMPVEDVEALVKIVHDRLSPETAKNIISAYESGHECGH